jgi:hypothetical protein
MLWYIKNPPTAPNNRKSPPVQTRLNQTGKVFSIITLPRIKQDDQDIREISRIFFGIPG